MVVQDSPILDPAATVRDGLALSAEGLPRRFLAREAHEPVVQGAAQPDQHGDAGKNDDEPGEPAQTTQPRSLAARVAIGWHFAESRVVATARVHALKGYPKSSMSSSVVLIVRRVSGREPNGVQLYPLDNFKPSGAARNDLLAFAP